MLADLSPQAGRGEMWQPLVLNVIGLPKDRTVQPAVPAHHGCSKIDCLAGLMIV
jgi:hypothetical protein